MREPKTEKQKHWAAILKDAEQSGETLADYAGQKGLNVQSLYPPDIRKAIYTTNAIESLNNVIRKATKQRKVFPTNESALKVVYLAMNLAAKKWTMPIMAVEVGTEQI